MVMEKIENWIKGNGFVGFGSLALVGVGIFMGWWIVSMGAFGFFLGKNWEIIRNLWNEKYKEKVEDFVDEVKDKIKK